MAPSNSLWSTGPEYPLFYHGEEHAGSPLYDDWCRIVEELPHGTTCGSHTFIGAWVVVATYPDDDQYVVPRSQLSPRPSLVERRMR